MKQLLIVKPGAISDQHKEELSNEGFIIIESHEPDSIRVINQFEGIGNDAVVNAAFTAIHNTAHGSNVRNYFVDSILKTIVKK